MEVEEFGGMKDLGKRRGEDKRLSRGGLLLGGNRWVKQEPGGWKFQESCCEAERQQSPQASLSEGLSVTYEAFAVQYLFLFPCMVNYCSQCLIRRRPRARVICEFTALSRSKEADKLLGGGCLDSHEKTLWRNMSKRWGLLWHKETKG